ncbi:MAG TPA: hypothetical protein VHJ38_18430 [Nitrososphaeraceae archaeon]|nr:hypothetical protein [Nitrososphaeraceae archaeon]
MSDLPYNNNPKDECFYCSHIYTFHSSSPPDDNPTNRCSFVNKFDKSPCKCPGFRSSSSSSIIN